MANDLKAFHKKIKVLQYPDTAKAALEYVESCVIANKNCANLQHIIDKYIFGEEEAEVAVQQTKVLRYLQDHEVILSIMHNFKKQRSSATNEAILQKLFESNLSAKRIQILFRILSLALSGSFQPLVDAMSAWMRNCGITAMVRKHVAQAFITVMHTLMEFKFRLKLLPLVAPQMCINLLSILNDVYFCDMENGTLSAPFNTHLIVLITSWIQKHKDLGLTTNEEAFPVFAAVVRWVVLAPFVSVHSSFYETLLKLLLNMLVEIKSDAAPKILEAQHLTDLALLIQKIMNSEDAIRGINNIHVIAFLQQLKLKNYEKCILRFALIIKAALQANCISGDIAQLMDTLEGLNPHPIMNLVIAFYKNEQQHLAE